MSRSMTMFSELINELGLHDVLVVGAKFTWSNMQE